MTESSDRSVSKNDLAGQLVGFRPTGPFIMIDQPCELGYRCPVCKYDLVVDGHFDERLLWSEYNGFLWCVVCNRDYPSCLCMPDDPVRAIGIFLSSVQDALGRAKEPNP